MKYTDSGITFNNVKELGKAAGIQTTVRFAGNDYDYDSNDNPAAPKYLVNAIDIDWNSAKVGDRTINTTGELLAYIKQLEDTITVLSNNVGTLLGWVG